MLMSEASSQLTDSRAEADSWYTVDGRRLSGRPAAKGVYIHKCKKEILRFSCKNPCILVYFSGYIVKVEKAQKGS